MPKSKFGPLPKPSLVFNTTAMKKVAQTFCCPYDRSELIEENLHPGSISTVLRLTCPQCDRYGVLRL